MAEVSERTYQIGFAVADLETGLFQPPLGDALRESWQIGATINRYGRRWHLARMHRETPDLVVSRIGFVSESTLTSLFFDTDTGDFVTAAVPSGVLVPFAIRLSDGVIAYQLRPGLVREASFTQALEGLLNATRREYVWNVRPAVRSSTWEEWRESVATISGFNIRVERPNPHYGDDHLIEDAVESIRLEYLRLTGSAIDDEGIDPDAELFRQAVNHVLREYGRAAVQGQDSDGTESTWVKVKGVAASVTARVRLKALGEPEISEDDLVSVLTAAERPAGTIDLRGLGDEPQET